MQSSRNSIVVGEQRAGLQYTTVQKSATAVAVMEQILYVKQAKHHDMHEILPLLTYLKNFGEFPKDKIIPYSTDTGTG